MERQRLKSLLETLIFVSETPLKTSEMLKAIRTLERREAGELEESGAVETQEAAAPETLEAQDAHQAESQDHSESEEEAEVESEAPASEASGDAAAQLAARAEEESERLSQSDIKEVLQEMVQEFQENLGRGIVLVEVAGGWQFRSRPENAQVIRYFYQPKPTRLSKPSLETLSIVAYRQPITRIEIDEIRGVDSGGVLKTLCEKNLVRIVGKKDEPGKPMLYGTTQEFLELFQLKGLKDLPTLRDFQDLEAEFRKQAGETGVVTANEESSEAETENKLEDLIDQNAIAPLDEEEESILGSLEDNIKEVRGLEKEIFSEEGSKES